MLLCAGGVAAFFSINYFRSLSWWQQLQDAISAFCSEMRFTECMSLEPVSFWKLLNGCSLHEWTKGKVVSQHLECAVLTCPVTPNKEGLFCCLPVRIMQYLNAYPNTSRGTG